MGDMKLLNMPDRFPLLFDLSTDISEQNDLADKERVRAELMLEKLGMWNMSCPEPLFFQGNKQKMGYRRLYEEVSPSQPEVVN